MASGTRDLWRGASPVPPDIHDRLDSLRGVFARGDVRLAYVFGSTARGRVGNDVDLAVLSDPANPNDLRRELRNALQTDRVHLVELSESTEFLQQEVVSTGRLLYAADVESAARYESGVLPHEQRVLPDAGSVPVGGATGEVLRKWVYQRWNGLNRQVEQLWPLRTCTASELTDSELRWEVERGLVVALTYVVNILTALRSAANPATTNSEGPPVFTRRMSREFARLEETRRRLHRDPHPPEARELAHRLHHALEWLPVFLRETWDWLDTNNLPQEKL